MSGLDSSTLAVSSTGSRASGGSGPWFTLASRYSAAFLFTQPLLPRRRASIVMPQASKKAFLRSEWLRSQLSLKWLKASKG